MYLVDAGVAAALAAARVAAGCCRVNNKGGIYFRNSHEGEGSLYVCTWGGRSVPPVACNASA